MSVVCRNGSTTFKSVGRSQSKLCSTITVLWYTRFDGDGMIYACRIKDGTVNFSNRYVETNRLRQEKAAGHPLGLKVNMTDEHSSCSACIVTAALTQPSMVCMSMCYICLVYTKGLLIPALPAFS